MKTTALAEAAARGGRDPLGAAAQAELFERILARVWRYFVRLTGPVAAEDLTQQTLCELQRTLELSTYRVGCSFNTWTFLKAHSVFVAWCRACGRAAPEPRPSEAPADPAELVARRLDAELILRAIEARLGPETLECFVLRHEVDLSLEEVAVATGCTRRTVSRRLERARGLIEQLLGEGGGA